MSPTPCLCDVRFMRYPPLNFKPEVVISPTGKVVSNRGRGQSWGLNECFNMTPNFCHSELWGRSYGTKCNHVSKNYLGLGKSNRLVIGVIGKVSASAFQWHLVCVAATFLGRDNFWILEYILCHSSAQEGVSDINKVSLERVFEDLSNESTLMSLWRWSKELLAIQIYPEVTS